MCMVSVCGVRVCGEIETGERQRVVISERETECACGETERDESVRSLVRETMCV